MEKTLKIFKSTAPDHSAGPTPYIKYGVRASRAAREAGTPRRGVAREARGSGPSAHDVARSAIKNGLAKIIEL